MDDIATRFRLLGRTEIEADGRWLGVPRPRRRAVLAYLLLAPNRPVSLGELTEAVWGAASPATARIQLQNEIASIRKMLAASPGAAITTGSGSYTLVVAAEEVDHVAFQRAVAAADQAADEGAWSAAVDLLDPALALWRGPALADVVGPFVEPQQARLEEQRLRAVEMRAEAGIEQGRHDEQIERLRAVLRADPGRERAAGLLMTALSRAGRRTDALAVARQVRTYLREEHGLDPGPLLLDLESRVLQADPGIVTPPVQPPPPPAASRPTPRPHQLPGDTPRLVARRPQLTRLRRYATAPDAPRTIVVTGPGGVGKTALAVHWAHRAAADFPDGQLFADLHGFDPARGPAASGDVLRGFLAALSGSRRRIPPDRDEQVALFRSLTASRRLLLVLDNARDAGQVRPLLPGSASCLTVVTSRNRLTGLAAVEGAATIAVDLLSEPESVQLLTQRLGRARVVAEPEAVRDIVAGCGGLPLALAIVAGRAAADSGTPLAGIAAELRSPAGDLQAFTVGDHVADLRAVFASSCRAVSRPAARMFTLLSAAPGPTLSRDAAASLVGMRPHRAHLLLQELTAIHLVHQPSPGRYTLHDLVRCYAVDRERTRRAEDREAAQRRVLSHCLHTSYAADRELYPLRQPMELPPLADRAVANEFTGRDAAQAWYDAEKPTLLAAVGLAADLGSDRLAWQLARTMTTYLDHGGHWTDWVDSQRIALAAARRLGDESCQATSHRFLARAFGWLTRYDDAHRELTAALALSTAAGHDTGTATGHMTAAWLHERQQQRLPAIRHALRALGLYQLLDDVDGQADALNLVGWQYACNGDHRRALPYCERALVLQQKLGYRYGEANTWDSLGYIQHHLGHHRDAVDCYRQAVELFRDQGDRRFEATTLDRLGDLYLDAADPVAARDTWHQALTILTELHHSDATAVRAKIRRCAAGGP